MTTKMTKLEELRERRRNPTHALIIGKFYPPHNGHHYLIDTALDECDRVTVLVLHSSVESIPGYDRASWLQQRHPRARVRDIRDDFETDYSDPGWQDHMNLILSDIQRHGEKITHVYSSEEYGEELAKRLSGEQWFKAENMRGEMVDAVLNLGEVQHRMVDPDRHTVPMRATWFREAPKYHWHGIDPVVRAALTKRVVVCGAESSGTTTLAKALAAEYNTVWVPEWGRIMSETRDTSHYFEWNADDFAEIVRMQPWIEDQAARSAGLVMFPDTDLFATAMFAELYGQESYMVDSIYSEAVERLADMYIVTSYAEVPFDDDGFRLFPHQRAWQEEWFLRHLQGRGVPVIWVDGPVEQRVRTAKLSIDNLLATGFKYEQPLEYRNAV
jgi:HTH-type transcriptional repressor of NAD biosynthesis genes